MTPFSECSVNLPNKLLVFWIAIVACLHYGSTENAVRKTTLEVLFSDYDNDLRPNHKVAPLLMEVDLYVDSFANIAEADMEYTVFGYLRHYWTDKRLAGKFNDTIGLKGATIEHAWTPDTYITNARESNFYVKASEAESTLMRIAPDGAIFYSKSVKIVASCDMLLENFPMDSQQCILILGSYGYNVKDVIYKWKRGTVTVEKKNIAQFDMTQVHLNSSVASFISENFTQLIISFNFKRRMGYYIIQVYLPDSLVVAISWIVFWLEQDDMGGRVGLGITTILTIMFLLGSVNMSLPRVSYPKAIDWFLIVSFLFVFLVLLECIIVYILSPKKKDTKKGADSKILELKMGANDDLEDSPTKEDSDLPEKLLKKRKRAPSNSELIMLQTCGYNGRIPFLPENDAEEKMIQKSPTHAQMGHKALTRCGCRCECGKIIDRASRFMFPLAFVLFNVFYWHHYLSK